MFKYLRNINHSSNPTEVYSIFSPAIDARDGGVNAGSIVTLTEGAIGAELDTTAPMFLAISSKKPGENKEIKCIKISAGMLFEADIDASIDIDYLFCGGYCGPAPDATQKGVTVAFTGEQLFEIIDITNARNGKITVAAV